MPESPPVRFGDERRHRETDNSCESRAVDEESSRHHTGRQVTLHVGVIDFGETQRRSFHE